ncbi:unnamed protein product [Amoebophrya sp. A120]|nr:unnamed protein product [Amoebophrya sp. A120]|eukprot:GSA120T00007888001.1
MSAFRQRLRFRLAQLLIPWAATAGSLLPDIGIWSICSSFIHHRGTSSSLFATALLHSQTSKLAPRTSTSSATKVSLAQNAKAGTGSSSAATSKSEVSAAQHKAAATAEGIQLVPDYTQTMNAETTTPALVLDRRRDILPLDVAFGLSIAKKFVEEPVKTVLPTQDSLDLAYGCAAVFLPKTVVVGAPTGCTSAGRSQQIETPTGDPLQTWTEQCYQLNAPNLVITDKRTNALITQAWTRPTGYTNIVDLTDCNGNTVYTIHEMVYKLNANSENANTVYMKYEIIAKGGTVVAVTPYVPLFAESFKLLDPSTGKTIATLGKNGAWSPSTACPAYEKKWYIAFETATAAGSGRSVGLTTEDKRWVVAAFMTVVAVRDEDRNADGGVQWSVCTKRSIVVTVILLCILLVCLGMLGTCFVAFRCRESLIRFFFRMQERLLPRAMHKMR